MAPAWALVGLRNGKRAMGKVALVVATLVAVLAGAPATGIAADAGAADQGAGGWSLQSLPTLALQPNGHLSAVSCITAVSCAAVGYSRDADGVDVTLAESWDGSHWSIQSSPNPIGANNSFLTGVQCSSASACMAVGDFVDASGRQVALAERWNGKRWEIQRIPSPPGQTETYLTALSCSSASACAAVGYSRRAIGHTANVAERWDGDSWQLQPIPNPNGSGNSHLSSVSCATASACTAVGYSGDVFVDSQALSASWNGSNWSLQAPANPPGATISLLSSVSCPSVTECSAAGYWLGNRKSGGALIQHWDGSAWAVQPTPTARLDVFDVLSCSSTTACVSIGHGVSSPIAARWDGTTWLSISPPTGGLVGLSCASSTTCSAVGKQGPDSDGATSAMGWDGATWTAQATPNAQGASTSSLNNVSCPTARVCVAVGHYATSDGVIVPMIERWKDSRWSRQAAPLTGDSRLNSLSCAAADDCTAVGYTFDPAGHGAALAIHWDGSSWRVQSTPNSGGLIEVLQNVSCTQKQAPGGDGENRDTEHPQTVCTAVGFSDDGTGAPANLLAERWDGASWQMQALQLPPGTTRAELGGVSCATTTTCVTVGVFATGCTFCSGDPSALPPPGPCDGGCLLAEHWNGIEWEFHMPPNPEASNSQALADVSCPTPTVCIAVGQWSPVDRSGGHPGITLAESWNGNTWAVQPTPDPPGVGKPDGSELSPFEAVSCATASSCTAVGTYVDSGQAVNNPDGMSEHWDGTRWSFQRMVSPVGASIVDVNGVSCPTVEMCMAVGTHSRLNQANLNSGPWLGLAELYRGGAESSASDNSLPPSSVR